MLVECSVEDIPYTEKSTFGGSDGSIWTKLSTTKAYTDYFKKLSENEKITEFSSLVIEKSDNIDLFTTLVNDWAWLCQQTNVLHPITVEAILYRI